MSCFIEIERPEEAEEAPPDWIECYVLANIEPQCCGPLARDLNAVLPLRGDGTSQEPPKNSSTASADAIDGVSAGSNFPRTDHLKRIRRRPATDEEICARTKPDTSSSENKGAGAQDGNTSGSNGQREEAADTNPKKRPKKSNKKRKAQDSTPWSLDMLVGSVSAVDHSITASDASNTQSSLASILTEYDLSPESPNFVRRSLPGRPAHTREELDEWNRSIWPTLFFEERTSKYKEEQLALTSEEVEMMKRGMKEAVDDAMVGREQWKQWKAMHKEEYGEEMEIPGTMVMNPIDGTVVSRSSEERRLQGMSDNNTTEADGTSRQSPNDHTWSSFPDEANLLCTPVLLAIQGVSRKERDVALGRGMESKEFKTGQYLCTGYDVYLTKEPNAYEAMALVHSRVRRVIFGVRDREMGGLGGADQNSGIHCLPGTNHHYRAFRLDLDSDQKETTKIMESVRRLHMGLII